MLLKEGPEAAEQAMLIATITATVALTAKTAVDTTKLAKDLERELVANEDTTREHAPASNQ